MRVKFLRKREDDLLAIEGLGQKGLQDIKRALKPGGIAILSGLLRTQERRIIAAYASRGFRLERRLHRDAWSALVLRRA